MNEKSFDVGAMVFFLRKVIWTVPDFTVERYRDRLRDLHEQIERDGAFRSTMSRTLFELRKPATQSARSIVGSHPTKEIRVIPTEQPPVST